MLKRYKNKIDKQYIELLETILKYGVEKEDRTGTGTKSIFGYTIRHNMQEGFPALTTKTLAFRPMIVELLWFLKGMTNIRYLLDRKVDIWTGDAFKAYRAKTKQFEGSWPTTIEVFRKGVLNDDNFAIEFGELGPVYGKQWRDWNGVDQIDNALYLLENNPDSRRIMVNAWNVEDISNMTLPPCHYSFQFYTRLLSTKERLEQYRKVNEKATNHDKIVEEMDEVGVPIRAISLMWNQRSVDVFLGLPFNIASYATLLTLFGEMTNMVPDQLVGNLGDTHIYNNHFEAVNTQLKAKSHPLPGLEFSSELRDIISDFRNKEIGTNHFISKLDSNMFNLTNYNSSPIIRAPLNN